MYLRYNKLYSSRKLKSELPGFFYIYDTVAMEVAHFIDTDSVGGAEVLVVEICRNLKKQNVKPVVLHFGNSWIGTQCERYVIPSMIVPGYDYYKSIKTIPRFSLIFRNFLHKLNVDILHSHLADPITGACLGAFLSRTHHVGTLHDVHTLEEQPGKIRLLQCAALLGTQMITVSRDVERYIMQNIRFCKGKYRTIYNGIDMERFVFPENKNTLLKQSLGIAEDDFVFICVGRLASVKDHASLIKAFAQSKFGTKVKLLLVGDGPLRQEVEQQIRSLQVEDSIKMLGLRNDIPALLNISDVFVLASQSEGLSCSIIEAMAAGLPSVVTDVGGNPELIKDGINGILVPAGRYDLLAMELKKIYTHTETREKMALRAKAIAHEQYSMDFMLDKYVAVYRQMMGAEKK